jgi:hypothetical protein
MQFVLLIHSNEAGWPMLTPAEQEEWMAKYRAFNDALNQAGVLKSSNRLQPSSTAKTIRTVNGKTKVSDGPFAKPKLQLGGYYVIDVPDMEAALEWAARCPGVKHGAIEVRPSRCG